MCVPDTAEDAQTGPEDVEWDKKVSKESIKIVIILRSPNLEQAVVLNLGFTLALPGELYKMLCLGHTFKDSDLIVWYMLGAGSF